jgi:phosphoenolpyruvate-protein kinase (PTS system EI component)
MRDLLKRLEESNVDIAKLDPMSDVYTKVQRGKGFTVPVSPGNAVSMGSPAVARKMMHERFPGWTREQHKRAAVEFKKMKEALDEKWLVLANAAAQDKWGRPWSIFDYKISGIGSDEFTKEYKDKLRENAQKAAAASRAALAHEAAATGRS